jgi:hypothetical protein
VEEMTKTWMDMQQKAWSTWSGAAKSFTEPQTAPKWQEMMETWQTSVHKALETQTEGLRIWTEAVASVSGLPEGLAESAQQFQKMSKQWADVQKQLWDSWFQMTKNFDPGQMMEAMGADTQSMVKLWQEMFKNAADAQSEWMKSWGAWQNGKKE